MDKKDIINRVKILYQQIHLMTIYKDEFIEKLGHKIYEEGINKRLDEINKWRKVLKEKEG